MEDADKNSKSLVLITRVGSTPTTGIKRKLPQTSWWSFLFYLRRVRREQHCTLSQKKRPDFVGTFLFYMRYILRAPAVLFRLIPPLQGVFLPPVFIAAVLPGISGNDCLFCRKVVLYPRKKHQNPAPTIYSTVSYRFYNVFYEKGFTNEFQKYII